jgi:hypothetical protein
MTFRRAAFAAALAAALAACSTVNIQQTDVVLSGAQEVPAVQTGAAGRGSIRIGHDGSVSGRIATRGVAATQAHIHVGSYGRNGPVVVPLARDGDDAWTVPAGVRVTPEQYNFYREGNLYVNVHSNGQPGGEIRGQLVPRYALPPPGGH